METSETMDAQTIPAAAAVRPRLRLCPEHPVSLETLDRFAAGTAARDERSAVVRHLLTGCPSCGHRLGRSWPLEDRPEPEGAYDQALDRGFDRVLQTLRFISAA